MPIRPRGRRSTRWGVGASGAAEARPTEAQLRQMAEAWRPRRAVAARALWVYYRWDTNREGVL